MSLLIKLDEQYYAGVVWSTEVPKGQETTDVPMPAGMLVDAGHCPKLTKGKWANDDSPAAIAMSAKHHAPPKSPFNMPLPAPAQ